MTDLALTHKAKPRIAIMGEFSAGKSTLCNLLMRGRPLPERVTATRLAPVWMTKGPGQHMRVTLDGEEQPIDIADLDSVPVEGTRYIRLYLDADILDLCDFMDFPGISDPNMDAEVWERVLTEADAVIWLTHATQAWRQSEAAVWDTVPEHVQETSLLLITRFDKLVTETDRQRVVARVKKETDGLFEKVFPISLTEATSATDDYEQWSASGAAAFMEHLVDLIERLAQNRATRENSSSDPLEESTIVPIAPKARPVGPTAPEDAQPAEAAGGRRVVPRRVTLTGPARRARPSTARAL